MITLHGLPRDGMQGSRDCLQAIIDALDDALMVIDRDFRITEANAALVRRYASAGQMPVGRRCYEVSHGVPEPCALPWCDCPVRRVWETGEPARATHLHTSPAGDQSEGRYVEILASPVKYSEGSVTEVLEVIRDVTREKKLEQQILKNGQGLRALNTIASTIGQSLDLDTILASALDKVLELMKGDIGSILLVDEESQTLSCRVHRGLSGEFVREVAGLRVGEGIAGRAAALGQPIVVDGISKAPEVAGPVVFGKGLRAFISVPLCAKERVVGVVNVASRAPREFAREDVELLKAIGSQMGVAIENARLYDEVQRREEVRRELLRQVISAQEEERGRIARELHDETSQDLTALAVSLETVVAALPSEAEQLTAKLRDIQSCVVKTLEEVDKLIFDLRPTMLDDLGLIAALRWYVESRLQRAGIKAHFETAGSERRLPSQLETALFRVTQEAITNIVKHAGAESVSISLEFGEGAVVATIEDDGRGFDLEEVLRSQDARRGLGLLGMRERAELLGGVLSVQSQPGEGTRVKAEIPFQ